MRYSQVVPGIFLSRPNRFIAHCLIEGKETICHVKNTGRCRELLIPSCQVYLQHCPAPGRKTAYDIIAVEKNGQLFNIDSQAPNQAVAEWLPSFLGETAVIKPEFSFGTSRIDFYAALQNRRILLEVKGVTLENQGLTLFPDAPTARGTKHVQELIAGVKQGYECYIMFVIQTDKATAFTPNSTTDPAFTKALLQAYQAGVHLLAYDCSVTPDSMKIRNFIPILLP